MFDATIAEEVWNIKYPIIHFKITLLLWDRNFRGCHRRVMVKAMDCEIVVSEFVLQSRYYVHFQANTLGKGMNPLSSKLLVK